MRAGLEKRIPRSIVVYAEGGSMVRFRTGTATAFFTGGAIVDTLISFQMAKGDFDWKIGSVSISGTDTGTIN